MSPRGPRTSSSMSAPCRLEYTAFGVPIRLIGAGAVVPESMRNTLASAGQREPVSTSGARCGGGGACHGTSLVGGSDFMDSNALGIGITFAFETLDPPDPTGDISHTPGLVDPAAFRHVRCQVKKTKINGWMYLAGANRGRVRSSTSRRSRGGAVLRTDDRRTADRAPAGAW
jgi:hypothetical protein